jgi:N-glycosylase/DNA lyase
MNKLDDGGWYSLIAFELYLRLRQVGNETIELDCTEDEYNRVWKDYFDMNYDYSNIINNINNGDDRFLMKAVEYGQGIRILQQEPFEALISFIISQRKNIPAIKSCIEKLCIRLGERKESNGTVYYTFPTAKALAGTDFNTLDECGVGYRNEYIKGAARAVYDGSIQLEELKTMDKDEAIEILKGLYGVGDKVANCVALFGLHHINSFPIDVWMARIIHDMYNGYFDVNKYSGYAGIVQQYMFYYARNKY